jgi:hypothetical protein
VKLKISNSYKKARCESNKTWNDLQKENYKMLMKEMEKDGQPGESSSGIASIIQYDKDVS